MRYSLRTMLTASKVIVYQKKKKKNPVERLPSHKLLFAQFFMIFSDGCVLKRAAQTL